jgi:hypothetical protein
MAWLCSATAQMLPPPTAKLIPFRFFFAATANDANGLESDYSTEVSFTRTSRVTKVTLAWDPSPSTGVIQYFIYKGRLSTNYTEKFNAGTNLSLEVPLFGPALTNCVVNVWATGSTNILCAPSLDFIGPWQPLNTTNWTATNPPAPRLFRALGNQQGSKIYINKTAF